MGSQISRGHEKLYDIDSATHFFGKSICVSEKESEASRRCRGRIVDISVDTSPKNAGISFRSRTMVKVPLLQIQDLSCQSANLLLVLCLVLIAIEGW